MTSKSGTQRNEKQRQQGLIGVGTTHTKRLQRRGIMISMVVLVAAGAVVATMLLTSRSTSSALASESVAGSSGMAGMDHGSTDVSLSSPAPTASADMPMDMPGMDMSGSSPAPTTSPDTHGGMDMPGMDMPGMSPGHGGSEGTAKDRPLAPVLGTFGGGTSAVMLTAGFLRRRDRARGDAKKATRLARRTQS